jgi:hypothetical protein
MLHGAELTICKQPLAPVVQVVKVLAVQAWQLAEPGWHVVLEAVHSAAFVQQVAPASAAKQAPLVQGVVTGYRHPSPSEVHVTSDPDEHDVAPAVVQPADALHTHAAPASAVTQV